VLKAEAIKIDVGPSATTNNGDCTYTVFRVKSNRSCIPVIGPAAATREPKIPN